MPRDGIEPPTPAFSGRCGRSVRKYDCPIRYSHVESKATVPRYSIEPCQDAVPNLRARIVVGSKLWSWIRISEQAVAGHSCSVMLLLGSNNSAVRPTAGGIAPVQLFHELS